MADETKAQEQETQFDFGLDEQTLESASGAESKEESSNEELFDDDELFYGSQPGSESESIVVQTASHALSLADAAKVLGSSVRALERSIIGKWGKKLPEGWTARKFRISGRDEWRIIPPPGFRVRVRENTPTVPEYKDTVDEVKDTVQEVKETAKFFIERLISSSKQAVRNELLKPDGVSAPANIASQAKLPAQPIDQPMIIIDRSDEVEKLLRELAESQKQLAEERKAHLEDMRLLAQMQNSMRLLEVNAQHTATLKEELALAKDALTEHKRQYQEFLASPWWKRVFKSAP